MAYAYFEIDEYLWCNEASQGNVNVAGLVFDDLLEETLDLGPEEVLTVYSDVLEDTIALEEGDFKGIHWPVVGDAVTFKEYFGTPLRVRQTVLNLVMTNPLVPALIAHVHMDILHGVDIYWEEVASELQCHSTYVKAVPYYWEWIFESLDIDMTEPQPQPPLYLMIQPAVTDLVNMRHEIEQEYLFNSKCFEELFIWPGIVWGWDHYVTSSLVSTDAIQEIIGILADDYLYLLDEQELQLKVSHLVDDRVFIFDEGRHEKYYLLVASDTIAILDEEVSFGVVVGVDPIVEDLGINESISSQAVFMRLAVESLAFIDVPALLQGFLIEEGFEIGDVDLARWVFNVLAESGFDVADIIG